MIKMASFDKHDGKECKPMAQYSRHDYVSMQMLRSLIAGTIAFVLLVGLGAVYRMEYLMEEITSMDIRLVLVYCIIGYIGFLLLYEMITYIVAQKRYTIGRKKVKQYYNNVKKMNRIYEREERLKMPASSQQTKISQR